MTIPELRHLIGKTIADVEYEACSTSAYLVDTDGNTHLITNIEPTFNEEEA